MSKPLHYATVDLMKQLECGIICIPYCEGMKEGSDEQKAYAKSYLDMLYLRKLITSRRKNEAYLELRLD